MSGQGKSTAIVAATGNARLDGILHDRGWADPVLTYSAPTTQNDYGSGYGSGEHLGLQTPTSLLIAAQARYLDAQFDTSANDGFALEGFTDVGVAPTSQYNAHIRVALTNRDPYDTGTAWGYFPFAARSAGDVWLSDANFDYSAPRVGDYANFILIHELGHALGLEHGHEVSTYGALPAAFDAMEYTVMTYRSSVGALSNTYTNETWGYAQSFMMQDIAALQHIYGADFTTNSGDTVYSWTPGSGDTLVDGAVALSPGANRIFATIWDGGGIDTYDLGAYASDLDIDLAPGAVSAFDAAQLARLGGGTFASGNIYNARLFQDDPRSLIENAIGGSGNDVIAGNAAKNRLEGGDGDDTLTGGRQRDSLFGENGSDRLEAGSGNDRVYGGNGNDVIKGGIGSDRMLGGKGADRLFGGSGDDTILGKQGNDRLVGSTGADHLTGGGGADRFEFRSIAHSPVTEGWDQITDFGTGQDRIDLSRLVASPFEFLGSSVFSGIGPSVRTSQDGANLRVLVDVDGDAQADMRIDVLDVTTLTESDFLL